MWPFTRRSTLHVSTSARFRRREAAADQREDWARDRGAYSLDVGTTGELTDAQRMLAVRKSRHEYLKASVYGGVLDRFIDFVLGDGIVIRAKDPQVDTWLQRQLRRGWYGRERQHVEGLFTDGERLLVARALERTSGAPIGEVRIGSVDVLTVQGVRVNRLDVADVVQLDVAPEGERRFTVNVTRDESAPEPLLVPGVPGNEGKPGRGTFVAGAFWRVNTRGTRGVPVLLRTLDHASDLDNLVGGLVAQLEYVRRVWLHVKHSIPDDSQKGEQSQVLAFESKVKAWATSTEPGEVLVTGGGENGVKVDAHAPDMKLADARQLYDVVLEMCLGGHGIPKMWFGGGGDTNRAVAAEQGTPVFRSIQARQSEVRGSIEQMLRAILSLGQAAGVQGVTADAEVEVTMATVATRDSERDVREVSGLMAIAAEAAATGAITGDEARAVVRAALKSKPWGAQLEDTAEKDGQVIAAPTPRLLPAAGSGQAPEAAAAVAAAAPTEKVADTALNGAQVASLLAILDGVTAGTRLPEVAEMLIVAAFPSIDPEKAGRMARAAAKRVPTAAPAAAPSGSPGAGQAA